MENVWIGHGNNLTNHFSFSRHFRVKDGNEYSDLLPVHSRVPQGSVLGPFLYPLYTSDLPSSLTSLPPHSPNPAIAFQKLQNNLDAIQHWLSLWRLKANWSKLTHVTFANRRKTCPVINNEPLPQADVKYLGIHFERLTWHKHIFTKRKNLGITLTKLYWLLRHRSKLNLSNKLLIYKVAIKPIWT
jgi:hypothetical protein